MAYKKKDKIITYRLLSFIIPIFLVGCISMEKSTSTVSSLLEEEEVLLQKKILIKEMVESTKILHKISWPILKNNRNICKNTNSFSYGIIFATSEDLAVKEFSLFKEIFNHKIEKVYFEKYKTDNFPVIISVAEDSPAKEAGLKINDIILEINNKNTKNFRRKLSSAFIKKESIRIKILRENKAIIKDIIGIKICNYNVQALPSAMPNAYADGKKVFVTIGAIKLSETTDELAFLIGHELAHNIFHYKTPGSNEAFTNSINYNDKPKIRELKSILVYTNRKREIEADIKGLEIAYKGGFELNNVNDYWRRLSVFYPELIDKSSLNYKGNAFRASLISSTLKKIKEKYAR